MPIVLSVIENTKINSIKSSANLYLKSAELYISNARLKNVKIDPGIYYVMQDGNICIGVIEENKCNGKVVKIEIKGSKPNDGKIIIDKKKIQIDYLEINGYTYSKENNKYIVKKGKKKGISSTNGIITLDNNKNIELSNYRIYGNSIENEYIEIVDLPTEYQQVDYVEGNGFQYIDTGIKPTNTTKAEVMFELIDKSSPYILGSRLNSSSTILFALSGDSNSTAFNAVFMGGKSTLGFRQINNLYKSSLEIEYTEGSGYRGKSVFSDLTQNISNTNYTDYNIDGITGDNPNIYLFSFNSANVHKGIKIYNSKIWSNGELVRNFVPCYRKEDNIVGLYELIENKFYISLGSKDFIKGKNVEDVKFNHLGTYVDGKYEINLKVIGKNLLNINRQNAAVKWEIQNTNSRKFEFDKLYVGISSNNYFMPNNSSYKLQNNSILVTSTTSGYGVGLPIKLESNTTYTVSSIGENNVINIGQYDSKGNYICDTSSKTFTTTENTKIITVVLRPKILSTEIEYKNIQLEKGSVVTKYEPYKEEKYIITLDEPLRCVGETCDYIDYKSQNVVRYVDKQFNMLDNPKYETIQLPQIYINSGVSHLRVDEDVNPSKIEIDYYN